MAALGALRPWARRNGPAVREREGSVSCEHVRRLLESRRDELRSEIADRRELQRRVESAIDRCARGDRCALDIGLDSLPVSGWSGPADARGAAPESDMTIDLDQYKEDKPASG